MTSRFSFFLNSFLVAACCFCSSDANALEKFAQAGKPPTALNFEHRQAMLKAEVEQTVAGYRKKISNPSYDPESRDLAIFAQYILALNGDPAEAEAALRRMLATQVPAGAEHAGNFYWWEKKRADRLDENAMSFAAQSLGPIFLQYRDRLSPEFVAEAMPHLRALTDALMTRKADIAYTNIFLLDTAGLVMLGEVLEDPQATNAASKKLDAWMDFTRREGVAEYSSPIYCAVQIGAMETAVAYCKAGDFRDRLQRVLRLLWAQAAAVYFPDRAGVLAPPYSRNANYLLGRGSTEQYFFACGLTDRLVEKTVFGGWGRTWLNLIAHGYVPDNDVLALAKEPVRWTQARFGTRPGQVRSFYATEDFSLGSASAFYAMDDMQLGGALPDGKTKDLPLVSVVLDSGDSPYGKEKRENALGHQKSYHLSNAISAVQDRGMVLALLGLDAGSRGPARSVATNLVLPLNADAIYVDGKAIKAGDFSKSKVLPSTVIGVRQGRGLIAARFFAVEGLLDQKPEAKLLADGAAWRAGRFAIYHYSGSEKDFAKAVVRCGVLLAAGKVEDESQAQSFLSAVAGAPIVEKTNHGIWSAQASFRGTELSVGLDLRKRGPTYRKINGVDAAEPVFSVNGKDWMGECIGAK